MKTHTYIRSAVSSLFLWWPVLLKNHHFDPSQPWHCSGLVGTSDGNHASCGCLGGLEEWNKRMKIKNWPQMLCSWTAEELKRSYGLQWLARGRDQVREDGKNGTNRLLQSSPMHARKERSWDLMFSLIHSFLLFSRGPALVTEATVLLLRFHFIVKKEQHQHIAMQVLLTFSFCFLIWNTTTKSAFVTSFSGDVPSAKYLTQSETLTHSINKW